MNLLNKNYSQKDIDKIIKNYLLAKYNWAIKWEELYRNNGEKNISAIEKLIMSSKEDDELFLAKLEIEVLRTWLIQYATSASQYFFPSATVASFANTVLGSLSTQTE